MTKKSLLDDILTENKNNLFKLEDEVLLPLLEEINLIDNDGIRSFVRSILLKADSFWIIPSSHDGISHPSDEFTEGGNVLHTQRVTRVASVLCSSYSLSREEQDVILAACLIHDVTKGIKHDGNDFYSFDIMHPYTVGSFVIEAQRHDKEFGSDACSSSLFIDEDNLQTIMRLVRCHLGPWSPVPETYPITYMDYIVHTADAIACNLQNFIFDSQLLNGNFNVKDR